MKRETSTRSPKPSRAIARWKKRSGRAAAIILAGGNGVRLRPLTRELTGDDRPKQFVPVVGEESLLAQTRRRAALVVTPERTHIVLTASHEPYYREEVSDLPASSLVVQPESRGTAAALLYALLRVARRPPLGPVVVLPSNHWVSDDAAFMSHVEAAIGSVQEKPGLVVLLGIAPTRPESAYGWIGPSEPVFEGRRDVHGVRLFVEKPARKLATALQARGFLWNSFVLVGQVSGLLLLLATAAPALVNGFVPSWEALGGPRESAALARVYADLPETDLSRDVLASQPHMLSVLRVSGVSWDDLGDPARAMRLRESQSREVRAG